LNAGWRQVINNVRACSGPALGLAALFALGAAAVKIEGGSYGQKNLSPRRPESQRPVGVDLAKTNAPVIKEK
jgi:hypothetical protein